jgi:hypothetical protein
VAVVSWAEFAAVEPELAQYGWDLLTEQAGYAYLATITTDGAPRVHPVVPFVAEGRLFISVVAASPKVSDLRNEARYMLHATVGDNDTEFAVRGCAIEVTDLALAGRAGDHQELNQVELHDDSVLFELQIERVDAAIWEDGPPHRQTWRATKPAPE